MKNEDGRYPGGYNGGWLNKETWTVHLWLADDPGTYEAAREAARFGPGSLREFVEEMVVPEEASLASDLLKSALAWADWDQLYEAFIED